MFEWTANKLGYSGGGESSADSLLPYRDHISDHVMQATDGSVMAMIRYGGVPFSLVSVQDRDAWFRRHVAFLNAAADENVEIHEHFVSHRVVQPPKSRSQEVSPYAARLLGDYHSGLAPLLRGREWYMTIRVKPRPGPFGTVPVLGQALAPPVDTDELLRQLDDILRLNVRILAAAGPRLLGIRRDGGIAFSEIAEALYLILTTKFEPQPLVDPCGSLGAALYTHRVICGRRGFELRYGSHGTMSEYGVMGGWRGYPRGVLSPRLMDELLGVDGRFVIHNAIRFHTRAQAQEALALLKRQMIVAQDAALTSDAELTAAINELAAGRAERGTSRWSVAVHGETPVEVDRLYSDLKTILVNAGGKVASEGLGTHASYWAQAPAGPSHNWIRPAILDASQFAVLTTLCGFSPGPAKPRWGGHLFRLATTGHTPFDHDQFVGDVGHMTVIAPNGSGKTVFVGMCIAALDALVRGQGGTQIVLDVDSSNANTIRALEGRYIDIRSAEDSGVAPLHLSNTPRVRLMLRQFVAALSEWNGGPPPTPEERRGIADGVEFVMSQFAPEDRSFAVVREFMGFHEGGAGERFEPWCRGGEYGWAFDGETHELDFNTGLVGVNLTQVMNDPHVMPPMAMMLLWMASDVMDGRRCVLWAEEAPSYMPQPRFSPVFKGIALRARKLNVAFIAVAQRIADLMDNVAGAALIKQSRQFALFANDKAEDELYRDALGATEAELRMIKEGMFGLGYWSVLIKRLDGQSAICRFDLSEHPEHLAVLSATPKSAAMFKRIIENSPERAMAENLTEFWRRLPEVAA
jgi:type IV secretion system protein VirB4